MLEKIRALLTAYRGLCIDYPPLDRFEIDGHLSVVAGSLNRELVFLSFDEVGKTLHEDRIYVIDEFPALLNLSVGRERLLLSNWLVGQINKFRHSARGYTILLNGQGVSLPEYCRPVIPVFNWPLPSGEEIAELVGRSLPAAPRESCVPVLAGMTAEEIRIALGLAAGLKGEEFKECLMAFKRRRLGDLGLECLNVPKKARFGGLDRVGSAIRTVALDYSERARLLGIPRPRGWLMAGPPGTGKTHVAKCCAAILGFPLIGVGIDVVKSRGAAYFKHLLSRVEAVAPVVCYFDELDKFFDPDTGLNGPENSKETLGILLTWLQEKTSDTFVIATLNRVDALPPELTRAGRFDRLFYVGFPQAVERREILRMYASGYDSRYDSGEDPLSSRDWRVLLNKTRHFTGAELKEMVENAARAQLHAGRDKIELDLEALLAGKLRPPLYVRDTERVLAMANRARGVCENASSPDNSEFAPPEISLWGDRSG